jgi:hypothetical protein
MMNKQIFSSLATGCLLALTIAVPARAQMPGTRMRVTIPFDFIVRGKELPAGNYEIRRIGDSPRGLVIQNVYHKHDQVVFETEEVETRKIPNRSEIVFHGYGDTYYLSEVLTAGEETGEELVPSHAEQRLRRELASNSAEPETVSLAVY